MGTIPRPVGTLLLHLDGKAVGVIRSLDGGDITAEIIQPPTGPQAVVDKTVGPPKYEDALIEADLNLDAELYGWIAGAWDGKFARRDVSVIVADQAGNAREERQYFNALITEVAFPALDASSKDTVFLTLRISPEYSRIRKGSGQKATGGLAGAKKKNWLSSNFKLEIEGLDCSKVTKIAGFSVRQTIAVQPFGALREVEREPARLELPNLVISIAAPGAQTWLDWHDDFVVKGNNDAGQEKTGAIVILAPDLNEMARITLHNLGIFRIGRGKLPGDGETLPQVTAGLYCERMAIAVGK